MCKLLALTKAKIANNDRTIGHPKYLSDSTKGKININTKRIILTVNIPCPKTSRRVWQL